MSVDGGVEVVVDGNVELNLYLYLVTTFDGQSILVSMALKAAGKKLWGYRLKAKDATKAAKDRMTEGSSLSWDSTSARPHPRRRSVLG